MRWLVVVFSVLLAGCSDMKIEQFAGSQPRFLLEDYFVGKTRAWGVFVDRFGNLRRQFTVDIDGRWDGRELTLVEDFVYADGETDQRIWRIRKTGDSTYEGSAGDVIGVAQGDIAGNALNWSYDMNLKVGDGTWKVRFNDWMWLQPDNVVFNRATVSRFGIRIGEVTIFFRREPAG